MPEVYNKKLSLFVAWFNILVALSLPVYSYVTDWMVFKFEDPGNLHRALIRTIIMAVSAIICLVFSGLLVKGIKENRPKLMAPSIYLGYLLAIITLGTIIYMGFTIIWWTGHLMTALEEIWPLIIGFVILILCIIPVRKLYIRMSSIPSAVQPTTQVVVASEKPLEVGPSYMPVFENV